MRNPCAEGSTVAFQKVSCGCRAGRNEPSTETAKDVFTTGAVDSICLAPDEELAERESKMPAAAAPAMRIGTTAARPR